MLIFDFDGVLINSLDEVALTAYNTATGEMVTSLVDLPATLVGLFRHNRFHVQPIGDAVLLMNWCLKNYRNRSGSILTPQEYEILISGATVPVGDRTRQIYENRSQFIDEDPECWLALHRPYQPLWGQLTRRRTTDFVILTNKNRDATLQLCQHFGLGIDAVDIYSGDHGASKAANMRRIQRRFAGKSFDFIDDSVKNLRDIENSLNAGDKMNRLMLASWGYIGPWDKRLAQKYGYPVLNQKDLIALLNNNDRPEKKYCV
jgi:phosphoglycolate phosphatase-like HAD superfamily hydrolase